jgi:carboxymethylenebutenolidase
MASGSREMISYDGEEGKVQAHLARPETETPRPGVIVIHEIFGLVGHTKDVANRFAEQGYVALAPNLFSRPELADVMVPSDIMETMQFAMTLQRDKMSDSAYMQEAMSKLPPEKMGRIQRVSSLVFGGMPKDSLTQDLVRAVNYLNEQRFVETGRIASVGFCFGGGMSINLACHAKLAASVVFYGENPSPIALIENVACPVLGLYGAEDIRINMHLDQLVKAMVQYKKDFEMRIYTGAAHAFFNDTRKEVHREGAASDAWDRVLRFYRRTLLSP